MKFEIGDLISRIDNLPIYNIFLVIETNKYNSNYAVMNIETMSVYVLNFDLEEFYEKLK